MKRNWLKWLLCTLSMVLIFNLAMACQPTGQTSDVADGVKYELSADGSYALVVGYEGDATQVEIKSIYNGVPVKRIFRGAFQNKTIKSVTISNGVERVENSAFKNCMQLTEVCFPDTLISIEDSAFCGCSVLTEINLFNGITTIGSFAFMDCTALENVMLSPVLQSIGGAAFKGCVSLQEIILYDSLVDVRSGVFEGCKSLKIYCEAERRPDTWAKYWEPDWNPSNCPVLWGYKG